MTVPVGQWAEYGKRKYVGRSTLAAVKLSNTSSPCACERKRRFDSRRDQTLHRSIRVKGTLAKPQQEARRMMMMMMTHFLEKEGRTRGVSFDRLVSTREEPPQMVDTWPHSWKPGQIGE